MFNRILYYLGIIDVLNFIYIIRFYHKNKKLEISKKYNLRMDWIGRLYGTINVREEDLGLEAEVLEVLVLEQMKDLILWLDENGFPEIINAPRINYISGSVTFRFVFTPVFHVISPTWLFFMSIFSYLIYRNSENIYKFLGIIFEGIKSIF